MIDKTTAGYTPVSPLAQQCANCVMSHQGSCELVAGIIEPYAVCKFWQAFQDDAPAVGMVVDLESPRL